MKAKEEGTLCQIKYQFEQPGPSPISINVQSKEQIKEDKSQVEKKMQMSDFHVVRKLREGNFGKVYAKCYRSMPCQKDIHLLSMPFKK